VDRARTAPRRRHRRRPGYARWAVPTRVVDLIASAPDWVRRHLLVVEGTRVVERSVTWESSRTSDRVVDQRDIPVYAPDPALTLGEFVLAGWSEPENREPGRAGVTEHTGSPGGRTALAATATLAGAVLTVLLAADALLRAGSGRWWPAGVAVALTAVSFGVARAFPNVRRTPASGTIHPIPHSASRPGSDIP
jgi:hypothetical protein